jgi:hypothetical protein
LLGDGDKGSEIVYSEEKKIFCTGPTTAAKAEKNLWYGPDKPTNQGILSFVLFESPFTSVSTVAATPL